MLLSPDLPQFTGVEIAFFKPKTGVTDKDLTAIAQRVENEFFAGKEGLLAHFILKAGDGRYADVVFATSQQRAEEICAEWTDNRVTQDYLELLDPTSVDMSFWTRL